jgi:para-nitrobenzyl esterase
MPEIAPMLQPMTAFLTVVLALGQAPDTSAGPRPAAKAAVPRTPTAELRLDSGIIRGLVVGKDVHAYKGIPFAAPPVGERRWKAPEPPQPWQGVRDCFEFSAACPQKMPSLMVSIPQMAINAPLNEDCLYLNVWTPAKRGAEKLPVLYWIHGGGFVMGAASQPLYDGADLARLGCVVVSINYRLGLFGFLAHPALSAESAAKVSGNYGLLDQIEGLRWVKRNIEQFGGDPERVTIFGESAGGISVLCLMVAPEVRGLIHGAIAQSATGMQLEHLRRSSSGQDGAEQAGQRFVAACGLGAAADAAQLRRLEAKALVQAAPTEGGPAAALQLKPLTLKLGPIVDGQIIPDSPNTLFAKGREHPVPLIIGNTREEMALFVLGGKMPADEAAYRKKLHDELGDLGEAAARVYPGHDAAQIRSSLVQLTSDLSFVSESRTIARAHSAAGQKAYRYQFSRGTNWGFLKGLGAHHGADLAFVFQQPWARDDASDLRASRTMGRYWIQFAAAGDPNSPGLPSWPAYRADEDEMIDFAEDVRVLKGYHNEQLDVIDKILHAAEEGATRKVEK